VIKETEFLGRGVSWIMKSRGGSKRGTSKSKGSSTQEGGEVVVNVDEGVGSGKHRV